MTRVCHAERLVLSEAEASEASFNPCLYGRFFTSLRFVQNDIGLDVMLNEVKHLLTLAYMADSSLHCVSFRMT